MYKIVAIDADGTLLDKNLEISEYNKRSINAAQEKGVHIVLCSGRSFVSLNEFARKLELKSELTHIISFNGSIIYDGNNDRIFDVRMKKDTAIYVIKKIKQYNSSLTIVVYGEPDEMFVEKEASEVAKYTSGSHVKPTKLHSNFETAINKDVYKVIVYGPNQEIRSVSEHMNKNAKDVIYDMVFSSKVLLEFSDIRANKGAALEFVCHRLGLDIKKDAVSIGDNFNDLTMIKEAALGICMANGEDYVKQFAGYITECSNDQNGVAEVFEKFIL